jgi:hypothetical protein
MIFLRYAPLEMSDPIMLRQGESAAAAVNDSLLRRAA